MHTRQYPFVLIAQLLQEKQQKQHELFLLFSLHCSSDLGHTDDLPVVTMNDVIKSLGCFYRSSSQVTLMCVFTSCREQLLVSRADSEGICGN